MAQVLMCDRCGAIGPAPTFRQAAVCSRMEASTRRDDEATVQEVCPSCALVIRQVMVGTDYVQSKKS